MGSQVCSKSRLFQKVSYFYRNKHQSARSCAMSEFIKTMMGGGRMLNLWFLSLIRLASQIRIQIRSAALKSLRLIYNISIQHVDGPELITDIFTIQSISEQKNTKTHFDNLLFIVNLTCIRFSLNPCKTKKLDQGRFT